MTIRDKPFPLHVQQHIRQSYHAGESVRSIAYRLDCDEFQIRRVTAFCVKADAVKHARRVARWKQRLFKWEGACLSPL